MERIHLQKKKKKKPLHLLKKRKLMGQIFRNSELINVNLADEC